MNIAKLIKKIVAGDKTSEQASDLPLDAKLDLGEGRTASVAEMLEVERNNHCHAVSPDDYIEHEGVRYHVGTLVHHFRQHCSMGHHQLEAERPHAGETPEAFAARRVKETADAVAAAKADLDKATERANAKDATEAEKKASADAKARHDEATEAAAAATERLNSLSAIDAKVKAANEAQKAAEDKLAEAEKAKTDAEAARKNAEAERDNAKRRAGIESFSILATAADRGAIKRTFPAPSGGIANKLEKGRRLFGGAAVPSTAGKN
jgi:murein DD-endopeptidase MepM/ murein hydrolase activator NlpD